MAFEDRSSPSAATSPTNSQDITAPNSPESSRTSPYTCTTISVQDSSRTESPKPVTSSCGIFRITSFALSPDSSNSNPSPSPSIIESDEPTIQTFKYSIRNILQPDFGKTAVLKSRTPSSRIAFRPYEDSPQGKDEERNGRVSPPPLGSLRQTVSQIGLKTEPRGKSPAAKLPDPDEVKKEDNVPQLWPAWVYCTRYSDRPSSGPRSRRVKKTTKSNEDKRPRTAFSSAQLARLKHEFAENRYLTERRRQQLSAELGLNEAQIKIWFQNKRAKIKKSSGEKNPLALQLMAQGLYNHSTVPCDEDDLPLI